MSDVPIARILLIDDDVGKRYTVARQLRAAGFAVREAATGEEGLRLVAEQPDLVVLDVKLPDLHGFEVCRRIKADPRTQGVLVLELSARFSSPTDRARGLDEGADGYLVHPVEPEELIATVRALLRLRRAERRAETADQQREVFIGVLGHDLRGPLGTILMASAALRSSSRAAADHTMLDRVDRAVRRMKRLIEQMLIYAQSAADHVVLERRPTDLAELCRAAINDQALAAPTRPIALRDALSEPVRCDPDRVAQMVDNLVSNAVRHGEGEITIALARDGGDATLAVHNLGRPIPPDALATLFDPFKRAGGGAGGVGLGLYIVRQLAEAHGGAIDVSSAEAGGTTFTLRLPMDPAA